MKAEAPIVSQSTRIHRTVKNTANKGHAMQVDVEQGLTSHQTHRSYRGRVFTSQIKRPNQLCKSTEGGYGPKD